MLTDTKTLKWGFEYTDINPTTNYWFFQSRITLFADTFEEALEKAKLFAEVINPNQKGVDKFVVKNVEEWYVKNKEE